MSKDFENMANSFLDLWQRQLEATIKDPEIVSSMLTMMQQMQQSYAMSQNFINEALAKSAENGDNTPPFEDKQGSNEKYSDRTSGRGSRATVYGHGDDELHDLRRRVALLEERLAEMEQAPAAGSRKNKSRAKPKSAGRKPAKHRRRKKIR